MNNDAKKKITRKEQALQTRRKLFNAGIRLLGAVDIDEVRINDICDEVGVSVGVFYHYFSSKEDLLMEAYHFFDEEVFQAETGKLFDSVAIESFSSSYYLATRVIYSAGCHLIGVEPDYFHPIHQTAGKLPAFGDFSPIKLIRARRKL